MPRAVLAVAFLLCLAQIGHGNPTVLPARTSRYCRTLVPTDRGTVIYVSREGEPMELDPRTGESSPLGVDWEAASDGWTDPGEVILLEGSPDGRLLCLGIPVSIPDSLGQDHGLVPGPMVLLVCGSDGTGARPLALSMLVGGGPDFTFASDSRFICGHPIIGCPPRPADYVSHWTAEGPGSADAHLIDVNDGSLHGGCRGLLSDGFIPSPWSDLAAAGAYPPDLVVDFLECEVLCRDTTGGGILHTWVLPDAGLGREDGRQVLRRADGTVRVNSGPAMRMHTRLEDGRYLWSREGADTVWLGRVSWPEFAEAGPQTPLPGISPDSLGGQVLEVPGAGAVVYTRGESVRLYRLPGSLQAPGTE